MTEVKEAPPGGCYTFAATLMPAPFSPVLPPLRARACSPVRRSAASPCAAAPDYGLVGPWLALALASLLVAGLLSLSVVVGRLPFLAGLIGDPLFYKRCLVVHVDLALVVWFYAFICSLAALRAASQGGKVGPAVFWFGAAGVVALIAGGMVPGAAPVLANYIPVIDHPLFLGGLGAFAASVLLFVARTLLAAARNDAAGLPPEAGAGIQAAGVALILAATVWIAARSALPPGLSPATRFEFLHWGPGHVLQVANVCAMVSVWFWAARRVTGHAVLSRAAARVLFSALVGPHLVLPLLTWQGVLHRSYLDGSTQLMRWGIFPVCLVAVFLVIRALRRGGAVATSPAGVLKAGLGASIGLTLLGFVLGACIRSSTTLVPAHYHASLGGVTAAFMTATYLLLPLLGRMRAAPSTARGQLLCFGLGQAVFALGFAVGGLHGLGRKAYASEQHVRTLGEQIGLGIMGLGGLAAAAGGVWFLVLVLRRPRSAGTAAAPAFSPSL